MEKAQKERVAPLEQRLKIGTVEVSVLTRGKHKKTKTRKLTPGEIRAIESDIGDINATFKESVTYVMKAEYVWHALQKEFHDF